MFFYPRWQHPEASNVAVLMDCGFFSSVFLSSLDFANPLVLPGSSGPGSTITCPDPPSEDSVATIVSMGFSRDQAMKALRATVSQRWKSIRMFLKFSPWLRSSLKIHFPLGSVGIPSVVNFPPFVCRVTVLSGLWTGSSVISMTLMLKLPWTSQRGDLQQSPSLNLFLWGPKCAMDLEVSWEPRGEP